MGLGLGLGLGLAYSGSPNTGHIHTYIKYLIYCLLEESSVHSVLSPFRVVGMYTYALWAVMPLPLGGKRREREREEGKGKEERERERFGLGMRGLFFWIDGSQVVGLVGLMARRQRRCFGGMCMGAM